MASFRKQCLATYTDCGFTPFAIRADLEFECLWDLFRPLPINVVTPTGHIPEVERSIHTIKEDIHSFTHSMPFQHLPKAMTIHLVNAVNDGLNQLLRPDQPLIQDTSPDTIFTGRSRPNHRTLALEFGAYVHTFGRSTNTVRARTLGCIALDGTGVANGSYSSMSLATGQVFTQVPSNCTILPITDITIARI